MDERKFEIFHEKRRKLVSLLSAKWMANQCIVFTVKHGGGSVIVRGCFTGNKVGNSVKNEIRLKKKTTVESFRDGLYQ